VIGDEEKRGSRRNKPRRPIPPPEFKPVFAFKKVVPIQHDEVAALEVVPAKSEPPPLDSPVKIGNTNDLESPDFGSPLAFTGNESKVDRFKRIIENDLWTLALEVLKFDKEYLDEEFHKPRCQMLGVWFRRYRKIIVHWPREHLKSSLITVAGVVQEIIRSLAEIRIFIGNAKERNANDLLGQVARVFKYNDFIQKLYPDIIPDFQQTVWRDDAILLKRHGGWKENTVESFGVGSDITGRHYDLGVLDDIVSFKNSRTETERQFVLDWYKQFLSVMGVSGRIWIPSTRYHDDDLYAYLKKTGNYAISHETCYENNALSGKPIYKSRFTAEALNEIKSEQGPRVFSAQYLNKPISSDELVFKEQFRSKFAELPKHVTHYLLIDQVNPEVKHPEKQKDRAVVLDVAVCAETQHWYLNDYVCKRMMPSELIENIVRMYWKYKPIRIGTGSVGYERTLKLDLQATSKKRHFYLPIVDLPVTADSKAQRIMALEPKWYRMEIHYRDWMEEFEEEAFMFPGGITDDLLDALALMPLLQIEGVGSQGDSGLEDGDEMELDDETVGY